MCQWSPLLMIFVGLTPSRQLVDWTVHMILSDYILIGWTIAGVTFLRRKVLLNAFDEDALPAPVCKCVSISLSVAQQSSVLIGYYLQLVTNQWCGRDIEQRANYSQREVAAAYF